MKKKDTGKRPGKKFLPVFRSLADFYQDMTTKQNYSF